MNQQVRMFCLNEDLEAGSESHAIEEALQNSTIQLVPSLYPTPDMLPQRLDMKPYIVHFSGHGDESGRLVFSNLDGKPHVEPAEVARIFKVHAKQNKALECVVFNVCNSAAVAKLVSAHVEYAVGMSRPIHDGEPAIAFARAFYTSLAGDPSVEVAFVRACDALGLKDQPDGNVPRLFRKGVACEPLTGELGKPGESLPFSEIDARCVKERARAVIAGELAGCPELETFLDVAFPGAGLLTERILCSALDHFGTMMVERIETSKTLGRDSLGMVQALLGVYEAALPVVVTKGIRRRVVERGVLSINAGDPDLLEAMMAAADARGLLYCSRSGERKPSKYVDISAVPDKSAVEQVRVESILNAALARDPRAAVRYANRSVRAKAKVVRKRMEIDQVSGVRHYCLSLSRGEDEARFLLLLKQPDMLPDLVALISDMEEDDEDFEIEVVEPQRLFYEAYDQIMANHA